MFWKVCNGDMGCSVVFLQPLLMGYIQQLSRALEPQATLGPLIPNYVDSNTYTEKLKFQQRFVGPWKANWVTMPSTLGVTFRGDGALLELSWPRKSLLENKEEWEHPRGLQWRIPGPGSANVKNQSCRRGCSIQSTGNPVGTEPVGWGDGERFGRIIAKLGWRTLCACATVAWACPPGVHMLEAWSPGQQCWELVGPLTGGTGWEFVEDAALRS